MLFTQSVALQTLFAGAEEGKGDNLCHWSSTQRKGKQISCSLANFVVAIEAHLIKEMWQNWGKRTPTRGRKRENENPNFA